MKEYNQKEIIKYFGTSKELIAELENKVEYVNGIDFIDNKKKTDALLSVKIKKYTNGLVIEVSEDSTPYFYGVDLDKIKYWTIKNNEQIIRELRKSIIIKALLGKLLLGTLGVFWGTIYGTKKTEILKLLDNLLIICIKEKKKKRKICFSIKDKNCEEVGIFFKKYFAN